MSSTTTTTTPTLQTALRTTHAIGSGTIAIACIVAQRSIQNDTRQKEKLKQIHGSSYQYDLFIPKSQLNVTSYEIPVHDKKQRS